MKSGLLLFLFILACASQLFSQQFVTLTVADGLSSNYAYTIYQDHLGFIWFGTDNGLNRWDGYEFKIFKHDPLDSTTLSHNEITRIFEDKNHFLWICTVQGLNRYDPRTEMFKRFYFGDSSGAINFAKKIIAENDSLFWIATFDGIVKFNPQTGAYEHCANKVDDKETYIMRNRIWAMERFEDGQFILGTGDKITIFDTKHCSYKPFETPIADSVKTGCCAIYMDSENKFWFGFNSYDGMMSYDKKLKTFQTYRANDANHMNYPVVTSFTEVDKDKLWIASLGGGLNIFDKRTGRFSYYTPDDADPSSLSASLICFLYKDRQENIWIGSYDSGINVCLRWKKQVRIYRKSEHNVNGICDGEVWDLCEDRKGNLWIASGGGGVSVINQKSGIAAKLPADPRGSRFYQWKWLKSIEQDQDGNIWFGSFQLGRFNWHQQKLEEIYYKGAPSLLRTRAICVDSVGNIWFGTTRQGLWRMDKFYNIQIFSHDPGDSRTIAGDYVRPLYCDRNNNIWAGSENGLSRINPLTGQIKNYSVQPTETSSIYGNRVQRLLHDQNNRLWLCTDVAICLYDTLSDFFINVTDRIGLSSINCSGILNDQHGCLWLRGEDMLVRFNPANDSIRYYTHKDGFEGINCLNWENESFHMGAHGHIYYGGDKIVGRFHPDSLLTNPEPPPVVLTEIEVNYKPVLPGENSLLKTALPFADELILPYDQNTFSLKFAALDYTRPQRNQYAYRLEGLHDEWVIVQAGRPAVFTHLSPGKYTFHVKGSNNDGVWNEQGARLTIRILPPWWRTVWAYIVYFVLFFGAVFTVYRFQLNRARLKHQFEMEREQSHKLQDIDRMKSRFFANISHEFRTPLTLILGPLENYYAKTKSAKNKQQFALMLRSGRRLLKLINQLLDFSRLEAGSLKLQASETDIVFFVKRIVGSFMSLAERHQITLHFQSNLKVILSYIDHDKFEKIITNLLSNAFKFTPNGGRISVSVEKCGSEKNQKEQWIEIAVRDSGPGIAAEHLDSIFERFYQIDNSQTRRHEGAGIGLALTKEFVQMHGGEISAQSKPGNGSCFYVRLPLGRKHLADDQIVSESVSETIFEPKKAGDYADQPTSVLIRPDDKKSRLLIVEDNEDVRLYIRDFLAEGYQIKEASDGLTGLATAQTWLPEIIISDVMMPGMDGFELCKKLKTNEITSHIPVILLTARASESSKLDGFEIGADDYIIKPFNAKELKMRVKNLIESRQKLRQKFSKEIVVQPSDITVTSLDENFLKRAIQLVEDHMADDRLTVEFLAQRVGTSRVHLNRKIRALTDQTAQQFIRTLRLKRAATLLQNRAGTVSEIAFQTGFGNPAHFAECFKALFGVTPSIYKKRHVSK
ncbi:response regulator [candidate division KSB1 bacterium]|nr:response regulator [candidate division KSB1 bacterium]